VPDASTGSPREWIGRTQIASDPLSLFPARGLAALFDDDPDMLQEGSHLPAGWHWLYFKPTPRQSELATDGHARRGAFLPPVTLPRRMWAGGRLRFNGPLRLGETAERVSTIRDVVEKQGRSGPLVFVTVHHRVFNGAGADWDEEQDIVYRGAPVASDSQSMPPRLDEATAWREEFVPDRVALFRFSALTFNGHRIHYDESYAKSEGYPDIVVHGPLLALLLLRAARRNAAAGDPVAFEYRAVSPLFAGQPIALCGGTMRNSAVRLWATDADGVIAMEARATW